MSMLDQLAGSCHFTRFSQHIYMHMETKEIQSRAEEALNPSYKL